jgi:hypothetical protein
MVSKLAPSLTVFLLVNYFVVMILKLGYKAWLFYFWGSA